jgi:hypothetical protein
MTECDAYKLTEEFVKTSSPADSSAPSLSASSSSAHSPTTFANQFTSTPHGYSTHNNELPPEVIAILATQSTTSLSSKMLFSNFNNQNAQSLRRHQRPFIIETFTNPEETDQTFSDEYSHMAEYIPDSPPQALPMPMINLLVQANTGDNSHNEHGDANLESNFYQRPNRPYSYYLATNFNPLDLSYVSPTKNHEQSNLDQTLTQSKETNSKKQSMNQSRQTKYQQKAAASKQNETIHEESRESRSVTKKLKKRLSTSMSDMLKSQSRHKSPNQNASTMMPDVKNYAVATLRNLKSRSQNYFGSHRATHKAHKDESRTRVNEPESDNDEFDCNDDDDNDDAFESNSERFQRMSKFSATMPTRLTMPALKKLNKTMNAPNKTLTLNNKDASHYKSLNRVNKFFRSLFGLNKENPTNKDESSVAAKSVVASPPASAPTTSKFTRMFSFRQNGDLNEANKNVKYTYTLATRQTSARLQSTSTTASSSTGTTSNSDYKQPQELLVSDEQPSRLSTGQLLPHINLDSLQVDDEHFSSESEPCEERSIISPSSATTSSDSESSPMLQSPTDTGVDLNTELTLQTKQYNPTEAESKFEAFKERFYADIAERLKKTAANSELYYSSSGVSSSSSAAAPMNNVNSESNQQKASISSIDSIDIPFIDDDDEYDEYESYDHAANSSSGNSSGSVSPNSTLTYANVNGAKDSLIDLGKLEELIRVPTEQKFDEVAGLYAEKYQYMCSKIAAMFELTSRTVQLAQQVNGKCDSQVVDRLKRLAARFIHDRYSDWAEQQGGWERVVF